MISPTSSNGNKNILIGITHGTTQIKVYNSGYKDELEEFRQETSQEGNPKLHDKYDPDDPDIKTWMVFAGDKLISGRS